MFIPDLAGFGTERGGVDESAGRHWEEASRVRRRQSRGTEEAIVAVCIGYQQDWGGPEAGAGVEKSAPSGLPSSKLRTREDAPSGEKPATGVDTPNNSNNTNNTNSNNDDNHNDNTNSNNDNDDNNDNNDNANSNN